MKRFFLILTLTVLTGCAGNVHRTDAGQIPEDFVLVSDVIPDAILEIRYHTTFNFIGDRIPGYEAPVAIMTRRAV